MRSIFLSFSFLTNKLLKERQQKRIFQSSQNPSKYQTTQIKYRIPMHCSWLSSDWFSYSGCITILLFFNWSNIMAPNSRPNLLYENDDIDRIHSFEKQGRISSDSWDAVVTDFIPFRYEKSFNRWASSSDSEFLTSVRFLLWLRCINHRLPDNSDSLCEWIQNLLSYRQKSQIEPNPFIISSRRFES